MLYLWRLFVWIAFTLFDVQQPKQHLELVIRGWCLVEEAIEGSTSDTGRNSILVLSIWKHMRA